MNRTVYYNYINKKLMSLMYEIKTNSKNNLLDLNIHSENFFNYLLNIVYDYNLINANINNPNIASIDLIDYSKKLLIQVTSSCTKAKIEKTLEKEILKEYKENNYTIKFVFIDVEASELKKKTFKNPYEIEFNPNVDIIDLVDIMKSIKHMRLDEQKRVFDFVKSELGEEPDGIKLDSNLTEIINILSMEDLSEVNLETDLNEFDIEEKIEYNNLDVMKGLIDDYKVYYYKVDEKYRAFDEQGKNKSHSIFQSIRKKYLNLCSKKNSTYNDDQIFLDVIEDVIEMVQQSKNYLEIPIEELEMCVSILVVDAFLRCKIFKKPRGYSHVTS